MKAIMLMFDSLNRRMLPPYGCDWVHMPNFQRLAARTAVFDNSYVGSMPCMPARREIHTGRYNFLHRSWGPMEPFDDSMPELLKNNGVCTHLVTDHYHYWEDGGATFHNRYSSYEFVRGQEGDSWKGVVEKIAVPENINPKWKQQDWVNRECFNSEEKMPQAQTFTLGLEFLRRNHASDNWFLTIETFDPHEPYFSQQEYKDLYPHDYTGPVFDWPAYRQVTETPEQVQHCRYESAALHSMCDAYLGKLLDTMDELNMWDDTMLIVNTDHGFLLGEHDWWAKMVQPFYNEVAHTPLFIWDPRSAVQGEHRQSLVQTIDLAPTLLDYFGVATPADMQGVALRETIAHDTPVREAGLLGIHGGHVNVIDGRYIYMRAPVSAENEPLFEYTLMPTHMRSMFQVKELQSIELAEPFSWTKGCRTMKIPARNAYSKSHNFGTLLFDQQNDYLQEHPLTDPEVEERMVAHLIRLMHDSDAPAEQYERLGLVG